MTLPEGRTGRLLAVGLVAALGLAVLQVLVLPLAGLYREREARLDQMATVAGRLERAAAALPALLGEADALRGRAAWAELAIAGATDALAGAALQGALNDLVGSAGSRVASAEVLPTQERETWRRIGVRVAFAGDLDQLATVLARLERARPVLFVDNMELTAEAGPGDARLKVSLDVFGYRADDAVTAGGGR